MPTPEQIGPLGAHLVGDGLSWLSGRVVFAAGSELAVVDEPRLLEVVRTDQAAWLPHALEATTKRALLAAEEHQASNGGSNPRFGSIFDEAPAGDLPPPVVHSCAVVADSPEVAAAITASLEERGVTSYIVADVETMSSFDAAASALASVVERHGPVDAVVVALAGGPRAPGAASDWERVLAEHTGIVGHIHLDACWARAVADRSAQSGDPIRLVTLTDATTAGGRTRAQTSAQLARAARDATDDRVTAFAVGVETRNHTMAAPIADLVAHLLCSPETTDLSGAELVAGDGWIGLRSHPRPGVSVTFGGPTVPDWLDDVLRETLA